VLYAGFSDAGSLGPPATTWIWTGSAWNDP